MKEATKKTTNQEEEFLNFLRPLSPVALSLMKDLLTLLAKSVLAPLGLTAAASSTDEAIQKTFFRSGMTALLIFNKEIEDIMKMVKSLEESSLLTKGVSETIKKLSKITKMWIFRNVIAYISCKYVGKYVSREI